MTCYSNGIDPSIHALQEKIAVHCLLAGIGGHWAWLRSGMGERPSSARAWFTKVMSFVCIVDRNTGANCSSILITLWIWSTANNNSSAIRFGFSSWRRSAMRGLSWTSGAYTLCCCRLNSRHISGVSQFSILSMQFKTFFSVDISKGVQYLLIVFGSLSQKHIKR